MSRSVPSALLVAAFALTIGCRNPDKGGDNPVLCDLEDAITDNSSFATAHVIPMETEAVDGVWAFDGHLCKGDEDWFAFPAFAGQTVSADLSFAQSVGDLQIELLSSEGASLELSESNTDMEAVRRTLTADDTLYLRIFGESTLSENDYHLALNVAGNACTLDASEPNNSSLAPTVITEATTLTTLTDLTVCFGEDDWYQIPVNDGQVASVSMIFDSAQAELQGELYQLDSSNNLVWVATSAPAEDGARFVTRVSGVGPFVLHVTRGANTLNANYQLQVEITGDVCAADPWEPNDGYYDATEVTDTTLLEGGTVCLGDHDWYRVNLENGVVLQSHLIFDQETQGDLGLRLYQLLDDGTISYLLGSSTWSDDEAITYRPTADGQFLLDVFAEHGTAIGGYNLDIELLGDACVDDSHEPNDSYLLPTALETGTYANMTLCVGDDDWYAFEAVNGQLITAEIGFEHDQNDLGLVLYKLSPDGSLLWRTGSDTYADDEAFAYRPFEGGEYLMRVYRSRGTQLASYSMDFAVTGQACNPDSHEPNDGYPSAAAVSNGTSSETLCVGDSDWYAVEVANGQLVDVDIDFTHAQNDLGLSLYRLFPDGTLSYRSGSDSLTDGERVIYRSYEDGTFLYNVYRSRGTQLANYDMNVNVSGAACLPDAFEPNDSYDEAYEGDLLQEGTYGGQTLCVGDADWYKFEASNGQIIRANLDFVHTDNDLGVAIYKRNEDGTLTHRASADTLSDDESLTYQPYDDGTFFLYVYRSRGTNLATYGLSFQIDGNACSGDASEPNNAISEASPLASGADLDQTLCVGDTDWYTFEAQNGQFIRAFIDFSHAQNDLGMVLYKRNDDGTWSYRSGSDDLTDDEELLYQPYDDGTFLLNVYRTRGTNVAAYGLELDVTGSVCEPDSFEPSNSGFEAATLAEGTQDDLTLCVGDTDWYSFNANNGQSIRAGITFAAATNDLGMALYKVNRDGTWTYRAGSDTLANNESILYQPYDDGEFLLNVYRTRGTTVATYDMGLDITGSVCAADAQEPNNTSFEAASISASYSGAQTLCVGDADWYEVNAINGQIITVNAGFDVATVDLGVQIYKLNADGTTSYRAGSDALTTEETLIYQPYDSGTFLVYVYRSRGTTVADYTLDVDVTGAGCFPDRYEPNDSYTAARDMNGLFSGVTSTYADLTLCVGDDDYYEFHGENGQLVTAQIDFLHTQNDLGFYLYRINGDGTMTGLAGSDSLTNNEFLVYRLFQEADYVLRVYRSRGTTLATYGMRVTLSEEACEDDTFEPNDHWLQATSYVSSINAVAPTAMTSCVGDADYLDLGTVAQGKVITAKAFYTYAMGVSDIDIYLYVLNDNGTLTHVATAATASNDEYLVYTVPSTYAGKKFILYAARGSGVAISAYDLQVTIP